MDVDKLVDEIIANNNSVDVVDRLTELGVSMLGTDNEEIGLSLLTVLKDAVDNRIKAFETKAFEPLIKITNRFELLQKLQRFNVRI